MLSGRGCGETLSQLGETGALGCNVATQWRKPTVGGEGHGADSLILPDSPLGEPNFSFQLGAEPANDPEHPGTVADSRFRLCQLRPGIAQRRSNRLRGDKQLAIQGQSGVVHMGLPQAKGRRRPDPPRRATATPSRPPQNVGSLDPVRQVVDQLLSWQHVCNLDSARFTLTSQPSWLSSSAPTSFTAIRSRPRHACYFFLGIPFGALQRRDRTRCQPTSFLQFAHH
jgi:hypothetical protein